MLIERLAICNRCPLRKGAICTVADKPFALRISANDCEKFNEPQPVRVIPADPSPNPPGPERELEALARKGGDNLGDDVKKIIDAFGGERVKKWIESKTGKPCKCPKRQKDLNRLPGFTKIKEAFLSIF